jgi:hypothetical protein
MLWATRPAGIAFIPAISVFVVCWLANECSAAEWPGFRGGEYLGDASQHVAPTNWSESSNTNVLWRSPIAGRGHSSPVIYGERVILTTAYPSRNVQRLGQLALWTMIVLLCPIAAAVSAQVYRLSSESVGRGRRYWQTMSMSTMTAVFGLVSFLLIYADNLFDYDRCPIRRWLGMSLLLSLSILLMTYLVKRASNATLAFTVVAFVTALATCMALPSKEHAFRGGVLAPNALVVWGFAAVPALIGLACIAEWIAFRVLPRRVNGTLPTMRQPGRTIGSAAAASIILIAFAASLGNLVLVAGTDDRIPPWPATTGWFICSVIGCLVCWGWMLRNDNSGHSAAQTRLKSVLIALGFTIFGSALVIVVICFTHSETVSACR